MGEERFKTYKDVFDQFTIKTIFDLSAKGHFEGLESPISIGKESNIFSAATKDGNRVILKVYRLETCDFNRMYDYIRADPRYVDLPKNRRKVIFAWAQREYRNLLKAREAGVSCPLPLAFKNNVLILEFIGDGDPAPKLKHQDPKDPKDFLDKTINNMRKLKKANFVHTDLSPFNILNHNEKPVFIDFSQCTTNRNTHYEEYWDRDIKNVCTYFSKLGLKLDQDKIKAKIFKT